MIVGIVILFTLQILAETTVSFDVDCNNPNINAQTFYTWTINFDSNSNVPRNPLFLNFPNAVTLTSNTTAEVSGSLLNAILMNSSVLRISNSTALHSSVSIIVRNVVNPNSAINTQGMFSISSQLQSNIFLIPTKSVTYTSGQFASCPWNFLGCTQATNSVLSIAVTLTNPLPAGNNKFQINYLTKWENHYFKNLVTSVSSVSCNYSSNGGSSFSVASCLIVGQKIVMSYTLNATINAGVSMIYTVSGVNSPPTKTTVTSSQYRVTTLDGNDMVIDSLSSCQILDVCVTSASNGVFTNTSKTVNARYGDPQVTFAASNPIGVTIQQYDTIQMSFSPLSSLLTCSRVSMIRDTPYIAMTTVSSATHLSMVLPQSTPTNKLPNSQINNQIVFYLQCSNFRLPESTTTQALSINFYRSGSHYLQLTATMQTTEVTFNTSNANLTLLSSYAMAATTRYQFAFTNGQKLGTSPSFWITFPTDIVLPSSPICTVTVALLTVNNFSCVSDGNILKISVATSSQITGHTVTISVDNIVNPLEPRTYFFGLTTYYNSQDLSGRVQTNTNAFQATYTAIINYNAILSPSSLTVYQITTISISFRTIIDLPTNSQFTVEFPSQVPSIFSSLSQILLNNGTGVPLNSSLFNSTRISFVTGAAIGRGSLLTIQASITVPSSIRQYTFVNFWVRKAGVLYISSESSLFLNVDTLSFMTVALSPDNSIAGATSNYTIRLGMNIPHPSTFTVRVIVPSDTIFDSIGSFCSLNCNSNISQHNISSFSFTAINPTPNLTNFALDFKISKFTVPTKTGAGLAWIIATSSAAGQISNQAVQPTVSLPNILTGFLSQQDYYYRNKTGPVDFRLIFANNPIPGDTILIGISSRIYKQTGSIACTSLYGSCGSPLQNSSDYLILPFFPDSNITQLTNKTLRIIISGLTSGLNTPYNLIQYIDVATWTSDNKKRDQGRIQYSISCGTRPENMCKTCNSAHQCNDCYTQDNFFLNPSTKICINNCGNNTQFFSFANNATGQCSPCINRCQTCFSATQCRSCITGNFHLHTVNLTCLTTCQTSNGFVAINQSGSLFCMPCHSSDCLECSSTAVNGCNKCRSGVIDSGICYSTCPLSSSYVSVAQGKCMPCHVSCASCSGQGNTRCIVCALNYFRYNLFCLLTCPTGTAQDSISGNCTCSSNCRTCSITVTTCTLCHNTSLFIYNGGCVSQCPQGSYLNGSTDCISCGLGCNSCSSGVCDNCSSSYYIFGGKCYSDCNQISSQMHNNGQLCILCPVGCDTCTGTVCSSCLSEYSLSTSTTNSSLCIKTCLISNTCDKQGQVIPVPGIISLGVWVGIVVIIKIIFATNNVSYSFMVMSSVIELILIVVATAATNSLPTSLNARLLLQVTFPHRSTMIGLLVVSILINYLLNGLFMIIFCKYIKPLMEKPKQIDVIALTVTLVIAMLTNFRFFLLAFSRLFPKPHIHVSDSSKLTPIHYLCILALILDILPLVAVCLGIYKQPTGSDLFMISIDLLIVLIFNVVVTICFVGSKKSDEYFQDPTKKYHLEEGHNPTGQTLPDQKGNSKAAVISNQFLDEDLKQSSFGNLGTKFNDSYQKFNESQIQIQPQMKKIMSVQNARDAQFLTIQQSKNNYKVDPAKDPDFQPNLRPKPSRVTRVGKSKNSQIQKTMQEKISQSGLYNKGKASAKNYTKKVAQTPKKQVSPQRYIPELAQQSDQYPQLEENSNKGAGHSVFDQKNQKRPKPRRVGTDKSGIKNQRKILNKSVQKTPNMMKKQQKVGYFQSDAYESNTDKEDLEQIIKKKLWQSVIKIEKPSQPAETTSQVSNQEISPSWFNVQNQRFDLSELGQGEDIPE